MNNTSLYSIAAEQRISYQMLKKLVEQEHMELTTAIDFCREREQKKQAKGQTRGSSRMQYDFDIEFEGKKYKSLAAACRAYGLGEASLYATRKRLKEKEDLDDKQATLRALATSVERLRKNDGRIRNTRSAGIDIEGRHFDSLHDAANFYRIPLPTITSRQRRDSIESFEQALFLCRDEATRELTYIMERTKHHEMRLTSFESELQKRPDISAKRDGDVFRGTLMVEIPTGSRKFDYEIMIPDAMFFSVRVGNVPVSSLEASELNEKLIYCKLLRGNERNVSTLVCDVAVKRKADVISDVVFALNHCKKVLARILDDKSLAALLK